MPDPLSIINDALGNTSNGLITQAQLNQVPADIGENDALYLADRSARAYARELPLLLERHTWPFAKTTEALEQADADDNPSNRFSHAYDWPYFCLWLARVEAPGGLPLDYEIMGRFICLDYDGTDADAPIATFIQQPQFSEMSNLFFEILRVKIEVGILRSVSEDYTEANNRDKNAEAFLLPLVRNRTDQQTPARRGFRSTALERRRSGGARAI